MEIVGDFVYQERKLARFLTLTGVLGIATLIVSLFQTYRRLHHPKFKQKIYCYSTGRRRGK